MNPLHIGESVPSWLDAGEMPDTSALHHDLVTQVCIVGGGIAGLTTAYLLQKEGKRVCVLEDYELGSGQSGRTTAQFVTALDQKYFQIERFHGVKGAHWAADSHRAAITKVQHIVTEEQIDCDLQMLDGYLFSAEDKDSDVLRREFEAAQRAGLTDIEFLADSPLPHWDTGECIRFPNQMQLHPLKYLRALATKFIERGGRIFTQTRVVEVRGGKEAYVKTKEGHTVSCDHIVVATNSPINDVFAIHTKQAPYRTYVVGLKVPHNSLPQALFWDTLDPFHYVRLQQGPRDTDARFQALDYDLLIVGGEDHKTGQEVDPESHFSRLIEWTRRHFPMAGDVIYRWSGQVMQSVDGMGFLGHNPLDRDNVFVITGDSGNGMTHATIGGMLITDQIMGRENPWESLYNPSRVSLRATGRYLKENANVAAQYVEWIAPRSNADLSDLPKGEGMVIREGLSLVAAYKGDDGNVELMSASCPHLAGVVHWNSAEKSWDCPCHGSRFDCHGKVIEGPAYQDLKPHHEAAETPPDAVANEMRLVLNPTLG